ncbi:MAG: Eco57I restriction-modification methylase domain-containing protein, partial [Leptolyngbyaceae bacterium]|nr:Eco57I restriction-modification methylase domain-containing protein [Leptolyngbyaceae bacterium]
IAEGADGLNWDASFPEIRADGGFDVVVGNPPYLDSERMTEWMPQWRSYCTKHYETAQGNWDLFCIFIEKAVMLCKPGGYHSFIVPNKLASATYATAVRSLLSQHSTILSVRDYSQTSAFSAAVYPLVYVVQKRRSPPSVSAKPFSNAGSESFSETIPSSSQNDSHILIRYEQMGSDLNIAETVSRLPRIYFSRPQIGWLLGHQTARAAIALKLSQQFPPLESIAEVQGAASVSEAYALKPLIHNHQSEGLSSDVLPLINSGTIDRYQALWGIKPLKYLGDRYTTPVVTVQNLSAHFPRRYEQAIAPKIIVAGMTQRLECVADVNGGILAGKSTSIIRPSDVPLLYLLGILNSTLIHHMVLQHFSSNSLQGGYLRIGPPQLRTLPIAPPREDLGDRLIHHVQHILHLLSQARGLSPNSEENESLHRRLQQNIQQTDAAIDQIVFQLYQLSQEEIEALLKAEPTR